MPRTSCCRNVDVLHPVNAGITGAHNFRDGMPSFDGIYSKVFINQSEFKGVTWVPPT